MCGITGITWQDEQLVTRMTAAIAHRGPNQHGTYTAPGISLGHRRLSILDLSENGKQPMFNEDNTLALIYNGEIYNYQSIKEKLTNHTFRSNTDSEVILHAYEQWGEKSFAQYNGIFAFALWDTKKKRLYLVRDRYGVKPLYYTKTKKGLVFGSELKALFVCQDVPKTIDPQATADYLTFRYVPSPRTMFKGVEQIPLGHYLVHQSGKYKLVKYAGLHNPVAVTNPYAQFRDTFFGAVKGQLMSDVPLGVFLSGGLDSGSVVAAMSKTTDNIKTFSVGYKNAFEDDELAKAAAIAKHYNTDHQEVTIDFNPIKALPRVQGHMDEPISDPAALALDALSAAAAQKVTVVLSGDGADETWAGYEHYKIITTAKRIAPFIPAKKQLATLARAVPKPILNKFFKYAGALGTKGQDRLVDFAAGIGELRRDYLTINAIYTDDEKKALLRKPFSKPDRIIAPRAVKNYGLNDLLTTDMRTFLQHLLLKVDKITMAHSLECRVPYLDNNLVNLAFSVNPAIKIQHGVEKAVVRQALANDLPAFLAHRKKQRFFVPIHHWFKDYRDDFDALLTKERFTALGLKHEELKKIIDSFHHSPLYAGRQLWALTSLAAWHQALLEHNP